MATTPDTLPPAPRFLAGPADDLQLSWRSAAVIVLFGTSLLLVNLGGNRVLTYHEVSFCEPAREMLLTGDWLIPRMGGVPFLDKMPLTAWIMAATMCLVGDNEFALRLPSVLAANITALLIAALAARWFGNRIAVIAGLMQFTMYYTLQLARLGECDVQLIAAVCGAMCSFAAANVDSPRGRSTCRWLPRTFYLAAGLTFLLKGPIGLFFIFSGCLLYLLVSQDRRSLRFFFDPIGLGIFALCLLPYPLYAYAKYPPILDAWRTHNLGRFQGELQTTPRPVAYYLYQLPLILLPWFPFAVWTVVRGLRRGRIVDPLWQFSACWMLPGMTLLSLSAFKSKHYPAPLMPALSIAAALGLVEILRQLHLAKSVQRTWLPAAGLLACAAAAVVVLVLQPAAAYAVCMLIGVLGLGIIAGTYCERRRLLTAHLSVAFATAWCIIAGVHGYVMPHHDTYRDQTALARRVNQLVPAGEPLYTLQLPESQIAYYLRTPPLRIDQPQEFIARLPRFEQQRRYVLAPEHVANLLSQHAQVRVLDRCESVIRWMKPEDRVTLLELTTQPLTAEVSEVLPGATLR